MNSRFCLGITVTTEKARGLTSMFEVIRTLFGDLARSGSGWGVGSGGDRWPQG